MPWRAGLRGLGRALMAAGLLLLLFVAYQLWGTGFHEARAQDELRRSFDRALAAPAPAATPAPAVPGDAVARIRIPTIGLDKVVVEGVGVPDLKRAPGHYPQTPLPGQPGNAAIAGHRTTYGAPFDRLSELEPGALVEVTTHQGQFRYRVDRSQVVSPSYTAALAPTVGAQLTLTTCHPRFSARQRLVVTASLVDDPAPAPPPPDRPVTVAAPGLSGDRAAAGPTVLWGMLAALLAAVTWLAARRWRWPAYLAGAPFFLVVLFVFYENVARLLPANI